MFKMTSMARLMNYDAYPATWAMRALNLDIRYATSVTRILNADSQKRAVVVVSSRKNRRFSC